MKEVFFMDYYSQPQFARAIGVSPNTIASWIKKGYIKPHHSSPTGRNFFSQKQVDDYFNEGSDLDVQTNREEE